MLDLLLAVIGKLKKMKQKILFILLFLYIQNLSAALIDGQDVNLIALDRSGIFYNAIVEQSVPVVETITAKTANAVITFDYSGLTEQNTFTQPRFPLNNSTILAENISVNQNAVTEPVNNKQVGINDFERNDSFVRVLIASLPGLLACLLFGIGALIELKGNRNNWDIKDYKSSFV